MSLCRHCLIENIYVECRTLFLSGVVIVLRLRRALSSLNEDNASMYGRRLPLHFNILYRTLFDITSNLCITTVLVNWKMLWAR